MYIVPICFALLSSYASAQSVGDILSEPDVVESSGGVLDTTITMEYANHTTAAFSLYNTRLLNGTMPGPTLKVSAGDTLQVLFENNLETQDTAVTGGHNVYQDPDDSNLHFHGLHVSGELKSDDVRLRVEPGEHFTYNTTIPIDHMPGTHWLHPHLHGSSALQIGGGAALAMIVQDPVGSLPDGVEGATERIMMFQRMDFTALSEIINESGDAKMEIELHDDTLTDLDFNVVNGQYQPTTTMLTGEWQRWRILHAGWVGRDPLDFELPDCEMQLLAKDGIYISDFPRTVTKLPIPAGGRADVMVRCSTAGTYSAIDFTKDTVLTVEVTDPSTAITTELADSWTVPYPEYLTDLTSTEADPGCNCTTAFIGGPAANGAETVNLQSFDASLFMHEVVLGSVVERTLQGIVEHPYHQHVYPFQLVTADMTGVDTDVQAYNQVGDWGDTLLIPKIASDEAVVRYTATVHTGRVMVHCHRLDHEDQGMMAMENVVESGACACDVWSTDTNEIIDLTAAPTSAPSSNPSAAPSSTPTSAPSRAPSAAPSASPTLSPSSAPSPAPSATQTLAPSAAPVATSAPTSPTATVTAPSPPSVSPAPSSSPSSEPSAAPASATVPTTTSTESSPSPTNVEEENCLFGQFLCGSRTADYVDCGGLRKLLGQCDVINDYVDCGGLRKLLGTCS